MKKEKNSLTRNKLGEIVYSGTENASMQSITEYIDTDYRGYSNYVIRTRCCPSLCDGLKTTSRKILHTAFSGSLKNGALKKLLNLSGETMNLALYNHGDASLNGGIVTLCQPHNFLLNPLQSAGQVGSLRDPNACASPRYLSIQLSQFADIWRTDMDLLKYLNEEGQQVEPNYFLPIIPVVLCNRQIGLAPGYRFSNMSYSPLDIIDACVDILKSSKRTAQCTRVIHPYIRDIDPSRFEMCESGQWVNKGTFTVNKTKDTVDITDLPFDMDYRTFEKLLNKYVESGKIKDWKNNSRFGQINYHVIFNRGDLKKLCKTSDSHIISMFKLNRTVPDDLLWVLDENNKVKHFDTANDLVEYFVNWRLTVYDERKSRLVKVLNERLDRNNELVRFIELVCKGTLKIRNRSKKDIAQDMKSYKLPIDLINTAMSKCTQEERDELLKQNKELREQLKYIQATTTTQMYLNDLKELRKTLDKEF